MLAEIGPAGNLPRLLLCRLPDAGVDERVSRADAGRKARNCGRVGTADAPRTSQLLRRPGQRSEPAVVRRRGSLALAENTKTTQPARWARSNLSIQTPVRLT
jgi:hypothetical protein